MPGDLYLSWEQLLDEDEEAPADVPPPASVPALPPRLQQLADERDRLEHELRRLTGTAEPDAEEQRLQRMFPVQVHTNATRIEQRRLRRHDEARRLQEQRRVEQRRIALRLAQQRAQRAVQARQEVADAQRLRERWLQERQQALSEAARKRAWEAGWHARRDRLHDFRVGREETPMRPEGTEPAGPDSRLRELARQRTQARLEEQRRFDEGRERQREAGAAQRALAQREAQRGSADACRDALRSGARAAPTAAVPSSPVRKRRP